MRYLLLFFTLVLQFNVSGSNAQNPITDHAPKILTSENTDLYGQNDILFRYQGKSHDAETNLGYNRFRYIDYETGTYISQDPIGLAGNNPTLYAYVHDPNSWVDVFGLQGFFTSSTFSAPSGNAHTVYQQKIDWDLQVHTSNGVKTNLELAQAGNAPFVNKNGKLSQINLHHSKQDAKGSLFELSASTHQRYKGSNALHPYGNKQHPYNPVNRDSFKADRKAYWIQRAEAETNSRKLKTGCH